VKVAEAYARAQLERKVLVTSEGSEIDQEMVECGGGIDATAVADDVTQIRSYPSAFGGISAQAGWEFVVGLGLAREAPRVGEQAAALLQAPECPAGVMDVVIDAEQVTLQLHESVGHPTELDRVLGFEAAYAGTSFLQPGDRHSLRYGSEHMNVQRPDDAAGSARSPTTRFPQPQPSCARACSSAGSGRARSASPARCEPTAGVACRSCA
jgi:TldD protein